MTDAAPVVTVSTTIMDGLVIRWRAVPEGTALLSASRNRVLIHGDVDLDRIEPWLEDARRAHQLLRQDRRDEVRAMATHEQRFLSGDITPITAATREEPQ